MTREELEKRLDEAEKQNLSLLNEVKSLKAKLIEIKDELEIPDMLDFKSGEEVFFVGSDLETVCDSSMTPSIEIDFNTFHSEHYAEMLAERSNYLAMLLHCKWYFDRDYVPDWNNPNEIKWTVGFNHEADAFRIYVWTVADLGTIAFSSKEAAQKARDWLNSNGKGITYYPYLF